MLANITSPVSNEPDIVTKLLPFPILSWFAVAAAPKLPDPIIMFASPVSTAPPASGPTKILLPPVVSTSPDFFPIITL